MADPTRPRCPATKTLASLSARKDGCGSARGERGSEVSPAREIELADGEGEGEGGIYLRQ
jgi:hypothetical protein